MRRQLTAITVGVLLLSACGSEGEGAVASGDFRSPIAEFLGEDLPDFEDDATAEAYFSEQQSGQEQGVAECMAREGFEYTPVDYSDFDVFGEDDEEFEHGSREWAEKWGFGITTQAFSQSQVGPDLLGYTDFEDGPGESFVDPNQEYRESLGEDGQAAYNEALYGDEASFSGPEIDESMSEEEIEELLEDAGLDFSGPGGCMGEAFEGSGLGGGGFYQKFGDEFEALYERIQSDPRITELEQEVSRCVADEGLEYTNREAVYESSDQKMTPLYEEAFGTPPELPDNFDTMTGEEQEAFFNDFQPPELSDSAKATLAELQAEEIKLAIAVFDCGGSDEKLGEIYQEVSIEYEEQFLEENADQLAEFKNSSGSE